MKKKSLCLVTGGAGFIGSHIVDHLIEAEYTVVVVDDLSGGFIQNLHPKAIFYQGSVCDDGFLKKIFSEYQFDYVFHFAAYAAEGLSHFIRTFNYKNNLLSSISLINYSVLRHVKRFVFASSIAVYGSNQTPMIETMTPNPEDPYGIAKYAVELDLKAAHDMFGLNYTIFRPHNVYGERQNHGDAYRNVIGIFINNLMQNKPMTIFGDGKQTRAFSYIDDVAPYIAKSIEMKETANETFNVGSDISYTILEVANIIAKEMALEAEITYLPTRKEVVDAYADHNKFKKVFPVTQTTPLSRGIKKMVNWSKKIGPLHTKKFTSIEIEKNVPPSWKELQ